jgi:hypothetical protein
MHVEYRDSDPIVTSNSRKLIPAFEAFAGSATGFWNVEILDDCQFCERLAIYGGDYGQSLSERESDHCDDDAWTSHLDDKKWPGLQAADHWRIPQMKFLSKS